MSKVQDCREPFARVFNHCTEVATINPGVRLERQCISEFVVIQKAELVILSTPLWSCDTRVQVALLFQMGATKIYLCVGNG